MGKIEKIKEEYDILYKDKEYYEKIERQMNSYSEMENKKNITIINIDKYRVELKEVYNNRDELNKSIGEITIMRNTYEDNNKILVEIKKEYNTVIKIIELYGK